MALGKPLCKYSFLVSFQRQLGKGKGRMSGSSRVAVICTWTGYVSSQSLEHSLYLWERPCVPRKPWELGRGRGQREEVPQAKVTGEIQVDLRAPSHLITITWPLSFERSTAFGRSLRSFRTATSAVEGKLMRPQPSFLSSCLHKWRQ